MKEYLVDTNIFIDVITKDITYGEYSRNLLQDYLSRSTLIINPIIFAEISVMFDHIETLNELLPANTFRRDDIPWEAAFLASKAFIRYKKSKGKKQRILADFMIGAHAAVKSYGLITRDEGYKNYFDIDIINPTHLTKH